MEIRVSLQAKRVRKAEEREKPSVTTGFGEW